MMYVKSCKVCQQYLKQWFYEELHPSYPPTVNFEWYVDLVELLEVRGY